MDPRRHFTADQYARALSAWHWLPLETKVPLFTAPFGDVFFESWDGIWWLNIYTGQFVRAWNDVYQMHSDFESPDARDHFLLTELALDVARTGLMPGPGEIYTFLSSPVHGGAFQVSNVTTMDFVIALISAAAAQEAAGNSSPYQF